MLLGRSGPTRRVGRIISNSRYPRTTYNSVNDQAGSSRQFNELPPPYVAEVATAPPPPYSEHYRK